MILTRWLKILVVCCFIFALLVAGCARIPLVEKEKLLIPPEVSKEFRFTFNNAEKAFNAGMLDEALSLYGVILKQYPPEDLIAWTYFKIGEIYILKGKFEEAVKNFDAIVKRFPENSLYNEARYQLAFCYSRLGRYDVSLKITERLLKEKTSPYQRARILTLVGDNFVGLGKPYDAFIYYTKALKKRPCPILTDDIKKKVVEVIDERLSLDQLESICQSHWYGYPSGYILFAMARTHYQNRNIGKAEKYINKFLFYNGDRHPCFEKAKKFHQRLKEIEIVDHHAIGCILPLTGRYAHYGNKALEAIILATGIFDPEKKNPIKLIIEDSKSDPDTAREAVVKLVKQDKVIGILGPLGSATALEAAREAQKLNVPILTLTQSEGITKLGDYVFRDFLTGLMQVCTLVKYSIQNLGMTRFAILYPTDNYGIEMMNLFWDEVLRWGGEIRGVESYNSKQTDFGREIKSLTGLNFMESEEKSKEKPEPIIGFDALFIPDSHSRVRMIVPQLAFYDVTGIQLLGTNSWNSLQLLEGESKYLEGAIFVDGFFQDSFYPDVRNFIDNFYVVYGREPDDLEALIYDAASIMVSALNKNNVEIRDDLKDNLLNLKNYPGITGKTSFSETGEVEKSLFVLMVKGKNFVQIN
ncbi:MAG: penicillin-binding protein activator [Thermodesulfobacteriota bacterium]|nr:penicillin-binding protein activator [Thermodesulfobacteriota bacterium]